jgi:hypothetical protein
MILTQDVKGDDTIHDDMPSATAYFLPTLSHAFSLFSLRHRLPLHRGKIYKVRKWILEEAP